jgi:hypothetical protein
MTRRELIGLLQEGVLEEAGLFLSCYTAIVTDNNDPEKRGRIKVKCPTVYKDKAPDIWIPQRNTFAGKGIGFFAVPNNGDAVDLTFRGGDVNFPLWEFKSWIKGEEISEAKDNYPDRVVIKRGEVVIELDSKENKFKISAGSYSLNDFIKELMQALLATTTATMLGSQPFMNIAEYQQLKAKVEEILL